MADVFSKAKRSEVMSRIRGRGNRGTELLFARLMRAAGMAGWRRHLPLAGRPDFAFRRQRVVVFIDGCFWHQCPRCSNMPATNRPFWQAKLSANVARDRRVTRELRGSGWRVVRIWEHELRAPAAALGRVRRALSKVPHP